MKKIVSMLFAGIMCFTVVGCNTTPKNTQTTAPTQTSSNNLQGPISGEITVSLFDTMRYEKYLNEAVKRFEAKYPGTKVNIDTSAKMPEPTIKEGAGGGMIMISEDGKDIQTAQEDYLNKLNTQMMSGKGPDVIAMDVVPFYKYAQSGQLEDLNQLMQNDKEFNLSNYNKNVIQNMQYKNGQYVFPLDYNFNFLMYDATLFDESEQKLLKEKSNFSYEELFEIGKKVLDKKKAQGETAEKIFGMTERDIYQSMWEENYKHFIDLENKKVNLNSGEFETLLETAKKYAEEGYINKTSSNGSMSMTMEDMQKLMEQKFMFKKKPSSFLFQFFNKNAGMQMISLADGNTENDQLLGLIANKEGATDYQYGQAYGINANSKNKQTAWAFVKFLASEEMQTSFSLWGIPIHNSARDKKAMEALTSESGVMGGAVMQFGTGEATTAQPEKNTQMTEEQKKIYDNYLLQLNEYAKELNTYYFEDTIINNMVQNEVNKFFDGSKSASDVAKTLQNKIELYVNE